MKKILIIEDDHVLRENTADFLREENFEVITASDGKKGVEAVFKEFPDLIISDISMPEMNGYEVFRHLQKNASSAQIPFIFLSAKTERENVRLGMSMGADDYITKPFQFEDLLSSVKSRIDRHQIIADATDEKIRAITDDSLTGVFIMSSESIEFANEQFLRMTGYSMQELNEVSFFRLLNEEYRNETEDTIKKIMQGENNLLTCEITIVTKKNDELHVMLNGRTSLTKNKILFTGNILDITDRKMVADQLQLARRETEIASKIKKEFLNNISHELRTPMNGILGMTELLLEEEDKPEHRQYLDVIYSSANDLLSAINELLEISFVESQEYKIKQLPFNLANTVRESVKPLRKYVLEKKLSFSLGIEPSCNRLLIGDETKISQVIHHLVHNAIKFTDSGQVIVNAKCEEENEGNVMFYFVVEDSGSGVPVDKQSIIFEAFRQADGSGTRKNGGLGLGLTISKKIIEAMDGKLWMQTEPGTGSIFCFVLKLMLSKSAN